MFTSVYILRDPRDNTVRYVGVTDGCLKHRASQHVSARKDGSKRGEWQANLFACGLRPMLEVIAEVPGSERFAAEKQWIKHYRDAGCDLVNSTVGGDGFRGKHSAATKQLISRRRSGIKPIREDAAAWRAAISQACKGRVVSSETRAKLAALNTGKRKARPADRVKQIMDLFDAGETRMAIAASVGLSNATVGMIVAEQIAARGQQVDPRKHSERTKARLSAARRLGRALNPEELAAI